ncbi:MAG: Shedu anti-phage system protein SduA domain-containing protein [Pseudomonadota bacterium]
MPISNIASLVSQGASERELQAELKRDLSILGTACAHSAIKDEYIAFSEFPIAHGNVDFVVFTDRSRMDVILIEVKGANFNFLNADGAIASDINLAAQQIRERFYQIQSNYEPFRREVHVIRKAVEGGAQKYNSVLGPKGYLHVDPEKDIDVRGIVIGGRTKNDLDESRARHQLEMATPRVIFESWDSWLRKHVPARKDS